MGCNNCEKKQEDGTWAYYFRLGNAEIGYGNIAVIACEEHASLLQAIFRKEAKQLEDGQWVKE